jgi:hypothetical protein
MDNDCPFRRIVAGKIPATAVHAHILGGDPLGPAPASR